MPSPCSTLLLLNSHDNCRRLDRAESNLAIPRICWYSYQHHFGRRIRSDFEGGNVEVSTGPPLMFNQATAVKVDILANNGAAQD
jgi:hypothetical protein